VQLTGPSLEVTEAAWDETLDSNLSRSSAARRGAGTSSTRAAADRHLGSTFSLVGFPQFAAYNAR
jgi:hypothetical protein